MKKIELRKGDTFNTIDGYEIILDTRSDVASTKTIFVDGDGNETEGSENSLTPHDIAEMMREVTGDVYSVTLVVDSNV